MDPGSVALRVLVADELDIVRDGLRGLLSPHPGWEICAEAIDGRDAVEKALLHRPDIAVLDLSLPELNGLEVTRQIRHALPGTEVMLLASQYSEHLAQEAHEAGARSFIPKTDAKRLLISGLEALAQHKPFFSTKTSDPRRPARLQAAFPGGNSRPPRSRLTPRERQIVQLVAQGKTSKEIAALLVRSIKTVEAHRLNIMNKLGLQSASQLILYAIRNKIVEG